MDSSTFQYYKLNSTMFDNDHWGLFVLINKLQDAIDVQDQCAVCEIKKEFYEEFNRHCSSEEMIMQITNYPNKDFHIQHHRESKERFELYKRKKDVASCITDAVAMSGLLRDHINVDDRELVDYIKNSQLAEKLPQFQS